MKVEQIIRIAQPKWNENKNSGVPEVSIILPTFRRAKSGLFNKCVDSVLMQTYKSFELIIIDDASTDGTKEIIKSYMAKDIRVKSIRHTYNIGLPAISEYEGVEKAKGRYIAFIFDDCVWDKEYLEKTVSYMDDVNASFCYGIVKSFYGKESFHELGKCDKELGPIDQLETTNFIANSGVVVSRIVLDDARCGLYDPHITQARLCDWFLWRRIRKHYILYESGIYCGEEYGATQSDSLGNTYKMNRVISLEREAEGLEYNFSVRAYKDIDITAWGDNASDMYKKAIMFLYEDFSKKQWYKDDLFSDVKSKRKKIGIIGEQVPLIANEIVKTNEIEGSNVIAFWEKCPSMMDLIQLDCVIICGKDKANIHSICQQYRINYLLCENEKQLLENGFLERTKNFYNNSNEFFRINVLLGCRNDLKKTIYSDALIHSGPIRKKACYIIYATKDTFMEMGLCFAKCVEGKADGIVEVDIFDRFGQQICCDKKSFEMINWNDWTYFKFEKRMEKMQAERLKIIININYSKDSVKIGVFELLNNAGNLIMWRIRKKLGITCGRPNSLLVDC